jgi:hypothetical protein
MLSSHMQLSSFFCVQYANRKRAVRDCTRGEDVLGAAFEDAMTTQRQARVGGDEGVDPRSFPPQWREAGDSSSSEGAGLDRLLQ